MQGIQVLKYSGETLTVDTPAQLGLTDSTHTSVSKEVQDIILVTWRRIRIAGQNLTIKGVKTLNIVMHFLICFSRNVNKV